MAGISVGEWTYIIKDLCKTWDAMIDAPKDCPHKKTVIESSGIKYFSAGEVVDYIEDRIICLDCDEDLGPLE